MILNHYLSKLSWNQDKNYLLHYAHPELVNGQICQQVIEDYLISAAYKNAVILTRGYKKKGLQSRSATASLLINNHQPDH